MSGESLLSSYHQVVCTQSTVVFHLPVTTQWWVMTSLLVLQAAFLPNTIGEGSQGEELRVHCVMVRVYIIFH